MCKIFDVKCGSHVKLEFFNPSLQLSFLMFFPNIFSPSFFLGEGLFAWCFLTTAVGRFLTGVVTEN